METNATHKSRIRFYPALLSTIEELIPRFTNIGAERKSLLQDLSTFIARKIASNKKVELIFICTHNSRRSHISQLWAQVAALYYGIENVVCYSGGTESTAFNPRAVKAMKEAGFAIEASIAGDNPLYKVTFSSDEPAMIAFSKRYDSEPNPKSGFAAIMTCSHADENCPVVLGMEKRIALPYDDPKDFDDSPQEASKYRERVHEIGTELLYAFSQVRYHS